VNAELFADQLRIPRIENRHIQCQNQMCARCKRRRLSLKHRTVLSQIFRNPKITVCNTLNTQGLAGE
jgi:hypothetical protein